MSSLSLDSKELIVVRTSSCSNRLAIIRLLWCKGYRLDRFDPSTSSRAWFQAGKHRASSQFLKASAQQFGAVIGSYLWSQPGLSLLRAEAIFV